MNTKNKCIVSNFIEEIWNKHQFDKVDNYIHPDFQDHSLPPNFPASKKGLLLWIVETSKAFKHQTTIEEIVCEGNKVMIKLNMRMKHIGMWRNIEPTGAEIYAVGYRYFKLENNMIIAHWALIDGNSIENQINQSVHGCKIQA